MSRLGRLWRRRPAPPTPMLGTPAAAIVGDDMSVIWPVLTLGHRYRDLITAGFADLGDVIDAAGRALASEPQWHVTARHLAVSCRTVLLEEPPSGKPWDSRAGLAGELDWRAD